MVLDLLVINMYEINEQPIKNLGSIFTVIQDDKDFKSKFKCISEENSYKKAYLQEKLIVSYLRKNNYVCRHNKELFKDENHFIDLVKGDFEIIKNDLSYCIDLKVAYDEKFNYGCISARSVDKFNGFYLLTNFNFSDIIIIPRSLVKYMADNLYIYPKKDRSIGEMYYKSIDLTDSRINYYIDKGYVWRRSI